MPEDVFESVARRYEEAASEMDQARRHAELAADHFRDRDVPRGCAHALASHGHLRNARVILDDLASMHAVRSHPET